MRAIEKYSRYAFTGLFAVVSGCAVKAAVEERSWPAQAPPPCVEYPRHISAGDGWVPDLDAYSGANQQTVENVGPEQERSPYNVQIDVLGTPEWRYVGNNWLYYVQLEIRGINADRPDIFSIWISDGVRTILLTQVRLGGEDPANCMVELGVPLEPPVAFGYTSTVTVLDSQGREAGRSDIFVTPPESLTPTPPQPTEEPGWPAPTQVPPTPGPRPTPTSVPAYPPPGERPTPPPGPDQNKVLLPVVRSQAPQEWAGQENNYLPYLSSGGSRGTDGGQ